MELTEDQRKLLEEIAKLLSSYENIQFLADNIKDMVFVRCSIQFTNGSPADDISLQYNGENFQTY